MIGTFSLLDVLLNMSMQEILQQLPLSDVVRSALGEYGGPLGRLLRALNSADGRDLKSAARDLTEQGIAGDTFLTAQLEAFSWASKIRPAA
jgi:EAL and modified HD-GYP domain-containing signal transduction protein